jgi:hypothetical protein
VTEPVIMKRTDPAMFARLTLDENQILSVHLTSGWYKQSAVYPVLSAPWRETNGLLKDLHLAFAASPELATLERRRRIENAGVAAGAVALAVGLACLRARRRGSR